MLASGPWAGEASFSVDGIRRTAAMQFTVDESGRVTDGTIRLMFTFPGISAKMLDLMTANGCAVAFSDVTTTSSPVAGLFASGMEGAGTFSAAGCTLEGVGELQFVSPVVGIWSAVAAISSSAPIGSASSGQAGAAGDVLTGTNGIILSSGNVSPNDPPTHGNDGLTARELYKLHCDECHAQKGLGSEKAPPLEGLNAVTIASKVREGQEKMDMFTHADIPDRQLNILIDYILKFHPDSIPRTGFVITPPDPQ